MCSILFVAASGTIDAQRSAPPENLHKNCLHTTSAYRVEIPQPSPSQLQEYRQRFPACNTLESTKNVRINIHFMLDDAGGNNFQANQDGMGGSTYNGYMFAEDIVRRANELWSVQDDGTYGVWRYNGTADRYIPMRVRLLLTGVYFHKNNYWNSYTEGNQTTAAAWLINTTYGVNTWNTINIYISNNPNHDGIACGFGSICAYGNGPALKMINCWHVYQTDPVWAKEYSADLLNHELGHIFGLYHDFQNHNTPPFWGDYCEDTPGHRNCWAIWDNEPIECLNNWAEQSNNIMSYSQYIGALTPCQINRVHTTLRDTLPNYIHSCDNCVPANAFFVLDTPICARKNLSGTYDNAAVILDGRGTFNEDNYLIEIFETNTNGSNTQLGNYFSQQYSGSVGKVNLATFCNYAFQVNKHYRIKLVASKTGCLPQSEQIAWVSVSPCVVDTTTTTPTLPPHKSLTITQQTPKTYLLASDVSQVVDIMVYDFSGKTLFTRKSVELFEGYNTLDLSTLETLLSNNAYVIAVQTPTGVSSYRFIMP